MDVSFSPSSRTFEYESTYGTPPSTPVTGPSYSGPETAAFEGLAAALVSGAAGAHAAPATLASAVDAAIVSFTALDAVAPDPGGAIYGALNEGDRLPSYQPASGGGLPGFGGGSSRGNGGSGGGTGIASLSEDRTRIGPPDPKRDPAGYFHWMTTPPSIRNSMGVPTFTGIQNWHLWHYYWNPPINENEYLFYLWASFVLGAGVGYGGAAIGNAIGSLVPDRTVPVSLQNLCAAARTGARGVKKGWCRQEGW